MGRKNRRRNKQKNQSQPRQNQTRSKQVGFQQPKKGWVWVKRNRIEEVREISKAVFGESMYYTLSEDEEYMKSR